MMQFRKKPVVVEAVQFDGTYESYASFCAPGMRWFSEGVSGRPPCVEIPTLEGTMTAMPGDWIITGVKGERYPCKPDIFAATYEQIDTSTCIHGKAMDAHCCNCHDGFIFDHDHRCPEPFSDEKVFSPKELVARTQPLHQRINELEAALADCRKGAEDSIVKVPQSAIAYSNDIEVGAIYRRNGTDEKWQVWWATGSIRLRKHVQISDFIDVEREEFDAQFSEVTI